MAADRTIAPSTWVEDRRTLLRAQQIGNIEVDVVHRKGVTVGHSKGSPFLLYCNGNFSHDIRGQIQATHYIQ